MKINYYFPKLIFLAVILWLMTCSIVAQTAIRTVQAVPPTDASNTNWSINVQFATALTATVGKMFMINLQTQTAIPLDTKNIQYLGLGAGFTVMTINDIDPINNKYLFSVELITQPTGGGEPISTFIAGTVIAQNPNVATSAVKEAKAKGSDDANVYISGEINGANKKKTSFSTEISISPWQIKVAPNNFVTPFFFKLNASTDADADPDSMEFGVSYQYRILNTKNFPAASFTTAAKIESERDFDNTNFISDTRFIILPKARPKGAQKKLKVFFRPFIGLEMGKNLRSPLAAAEGNFIFRPLAGAKLRFNYPLNEDEEREINWETSFTRRWLLRNELGYETNDDNELVLTQFGKSPRDYVQSKFSYGLAKFFDVFVAYDWGQLPPSYELVDHRFRVGFAYKFKWTVKK